MKSKAIYHLILNYLETKKSKDNYKNIQEIQNTLVVKLDKDNVVINFEKKQKEIEIIKKILDFHLYKRGDVQNKLAGIQYGPENRKIVEDMFKNIDFLGKIQKTIDKKKIISNYLLNCALLGVFSIFCFIFSNNYETLFYIVSLVLSHFLIKKLVIHELSIFTIVVNYLIFYFYLIINLNPVIILISIFTLMVIHNSQNKLIFLKYLLLFLILILYSQLDKFICLSYIISLLLMYFITYNPKVDNHKIYIFVFLIVSLLPINYLSSLELIDKSLFISHINFLINNELLSLILILNLFLLFYKFFHSYSYFSINILITVIPFLLIGFLFYGNKENIILFSTLILFTYYNSINFLNDKSIRNK